MYDDDENGCCCCCNGVVPPTLYEVKEGVVIELCCNDGNVCGICGGIIGGGIVDADLGRLDDGKICG